MHITYSDYILQGRHVLDNLRTLQELGATSVELLMDGTCWDDGDDGWNKLVPALKAFGLRLTVHPPSCDTNMTAEMQTLRESAFTLYRKSIEFADSIGGQSVVIHPGFCYSPEFDKNRAKNEAKAYIRLLAKTAQRYGICLLVENVGFGHASLYTQEEYSHVLDDIDPIAGYLIDTGHAHINHWNIPQMITDIAPRLYGFHLHDNDQKRDAHLAIGNGTIDWPPIFEGMKTVRSDCDYILEYSPRAKLEELYTGRKQILSLLRN